jgi:ABC-type sulfate/molybdate transport systems ATPase subunit
VFRRPRSRRVAELTGVRNIFEGCIEQGHVVVAGLPLVADPPNGATGEVDIAIRAERCNLRRFDPRGELPENCYVARVVNDLPFGNTHTLHLEPENVGPAVEVEVASRPYEVLGVASRDLWVVELPAPDLHIMPR